MKILYLYSELMGYQIPLLNEYVSSHNAEVHVVHWDRKKLTPYKPPAIPNVYYYPRSEQTTDHILNLIETVKPDIAYISGWMDFGYVKIARILRKKGTPVVMGFDNLYRGTLKQRLSTFVSPCLIRQFYSHIWVAGVPQYHFARMLGFKPNEILMNCYSADVELFNKAYFLNRETKTKKYPHNFVFIGRFELVKGLDLLLKAWDNIGNERMDWKLFLIGRGSLPVLPNSAVEVFDFMDSASIAQLFPKMGCFVLPSRLEHWGVVIHEAAAGGLPILCTEECGAASTFLIPGYNGYAFKPNDLQSLQTSLLRIIRTPDSELIQMTEKSHQLSQRISPERSAATFLSVLA